jgi:hypothetical protein
LKFILPERTLVFMEEGERLDEIYKDEAKEGEVGCLWSHGSGRIEWFEGVAKSSQRSGR